MRRREWLGCGWVAALLPEWGCTAQRQEPASAAKPAPKATRLVFGGDVMLSRYVGVLAHSQQDPAFPFRDLAAFTSAADIAFVNLEAPFSDRGGAMRHGMVFKAQPDMIAGLELAGIDAVSTANNHARDCGAYGVDFTLDWLARHKIAAVGTGHTSEEAHAGALLERNGTRFGVLAYTYDQSNGNHRDTDDRVAMLDIARMREDVRRLRERAGVVIVSMHAGIEYQPNAHPQQQRFARAAIDAGAQAVVGHHPHVVQPVEAYGGGVICYSLGNLVFDQFQRRETQRGLIFEAAFVGARLDGVRLLPVEIRRTVPRLL